MPQKISKKIIYGRGILRILHVKQVKFGCEIVFIWKKLILGMKLTEESVNLDEDLFLENI